MVFLFSPLFIPGIYVVIVLFGRVEPVVAQAEVRLFFLLILCFVLEVLFLSFSNQATLPSTLSLLPVLTFLPLLFIQVGLVFIFLYSYVLLLFFGSECFLFLDAFLSDLLGV